MPFYKFLFFLPDFLEIQRKSFYLFLNFHLGEELSKIQPGEKFQILYKNYKFLPPTLSIEKSIFSSKSYCCHFYFPIQYRHAVQWVFFGTLPLLTRRGHFLINGTPRILLNQILRSPGIYFFTKGPSAYADIISQRGPWIRLEMDPKKKIWICLKLQQLYTQGEFVRFPLAYFFQNLTSPYFDYQFFFSKKNRFLTILFNEFLQSHGQAHARPAFGGRSAGFLGLTSLWGALRAPSWGPPKAGLGDASLRDARRAQPLVASRRVAMCQAMPSLGHYLGQNGRNRLNKRLGLSLRTLTLTPIDFFKISTLLGKTDVDDIDDLKNRRLKTIGEFLQNQLERGLLRMNWPKKSFRQKWKKFPLKLFDSQPINSTFKEFFHSHQLSQYLDQSNPLAEITHKRRLSCSIESPNMEIREIHRTYYGRICPIETPEGKNAGLVHSLATAVHLNNKGFLETPFAIVYKEHFQNQRKFHFFSVENQEEKNVFFSQQFPWRARVASKNTTDGQPKPKTHLGRRAVAFDELGPPKAGRTLSAHADATSVGVLKKKFVKCIRDSLHLCVLNPQQFLSIATTSIPFLEHDDANRALMGSNMQRQALPLISFEQPIVTTLNSFRIFTDLKDIPTSSISGILMYSSQQKTSFFSKKIHNTQPCITPAWGPAVGDGLRPSLGGRLGGITKTQLRRNMEGGRPGPPSAGLASTLSTMCAKRAIFFQNLTKSNQNTYLLQRPISYPLNWIQKGDLLGDCSASQKGELTLGKNLFVAYLPWEGLNFEDAVLINQKVVDQYTSLHIEKYDIELIDEFEKGELNKMIMIGSWVQEGDILAVGPPAKAVKPVTHEKLLYDIVGEKTSESRLGPRRAVWRVPKGMSGRVIRISTDQSQMIIYIAIKREFQVGDKISGRHGNKGIISKILANGDMPYLSNGQSMEILLNPLGVPSRMNVGQIFECLLGLAGEIFHTKFQILCFDEIYGYEASRSFVYSQLFESCKKTRLFSKLTPGKLHLFDGRNGQLFHQSVLVGSTYIMKLIHIVDEKIHARATGPYSLITQQPLRGRAQHGGQRFGEMEVWALEGFGSAYTLQELLTVKSDDIQGRNLLMLTLLKNQPLRFGTPESLRVVLRELASLCLQLEL